MRALLNDIKHEKKILLESMERKRRATRGLAATMIYLQALRHQEIHNFVKLEGECQLCDIKLI